MLNFHLRGVPANVMILLKKKAGDQKVSVNSLILQFVEKGLGVSDSTKKTIYHDLDHLAGTWNDEEKRAFDESMKYFESLDEELWK